MRARLDLRERAVTHGFSFHTQWELAAPVEAVQPVLSDLERYPEWWPQVVAVAKIDDGTPGCCAGRDCPTPSTWC